MSAHAAMTANTTKRIGRRRLNVRGRGAPGGVSALAVAAYLMRDRELRRFREPTNERRMPTISNGLRFVGGCGVPAPDELVRVEAAEVEALLLQRGFEPGEAVPEPPSADPQRVLGIDLQLARERDHGEEQVAQLVEGVVRGPRLRQLAGLFGDRIRRSGRGLEVKAHAGG